MQALTQEQHQHRRCWGMQVMQELLGSLAGQVSTDRRRFRIISSRQGGRPPGPAPSMPSPSAHAQHRQACMPSAAGSRNLAKPAAHACDVCECALTTCAEMPRTVM